MRERDLESGLESGRGLWGAITWSVPCLPRVTMLSASRRSCAGGRGVRVLAKYCKPVC